MQLSIIKPLALHEDGTVYLILWIQEMDVAGCHQHFIEFLCQFSDFQIDVDKVFVRIDIGEFITALQKVVVMDWLNLKIIVEVSNLYELLI